MPRIKEYTPQTNVAGPIEPRQNARDTSYGKQIQQVGAAVQDVGEVVYKRQEQSEMSKLSADFATLQSDATNDLNERLKKADPNDPTFTQKFMDDFEKRMQKLEETASTRASREYYQRTAANFRGHFLESATQGQADLAGVQAKMNYSTMLNGQANALQNDPSAYQMTKDFHDSSIDGLVQSGVLPQKEALVFKQKGKEALAESAVRGWIGLDPNHAIAQLNSGRWDGDLTGDQKHQLLGEAKTALRAEDIEAERRKRAEKEALELAQQKTQNDFLVALSKNQLNTKAILQSNLNPVGSGSKEHFLNLLKDSKDAKTWKNDPGTVINLVNDINLPDGDPRKKIRSEEDLIRYLGKGLNMEGLNQMRAEFQGRKTEAGKIEGDLKKGVIDIAKGKLTKSNPMLGIRDPKGDEQLQKFMSFFLTEYQTQKQQGKSAMQLLDPESPDYLGKHVSRFARTPEQIIKDMVSETEVESTPEAPIPTSVPSDKERKPGESAADYLKRMGK